MGSTRRRFTSEYKTNAVSLVLDDGRSVTEVARGIGILPQTLGNWVRKAREEQPADRELTKQETEEMETLRRENAELRMKLEFAKKVSAWFAAGQQ